MYLSVRIYFPAERLLYKQCLNKITYSQIAFYSHIVSTYCIVTKFPPVLNPSYIPV